MYSYLGGLKWYWQVIVTVVIISGIAMGTGYVKSRQYDKARLAYEAKDKEKEKTSDALRARADAADAKIKELEPKVAAYEQLADQNKKLDSTIADKINQVTEEAKREDAATDTPVDCGVRADRTCSRWRELKPPLIVDCVAYKRKICS